MTRILRLSAVCALFALMAVSSFSQNSPLIGTVIDVDEGRNRLQIELDEQAGSRITIDTDAVSTVYAGFGTAIAGKPEIFTGSAGLSNVRLGDRIEVRGPFKSKDVYRAEHILLLGRQIAASSVGVGQTRMPTSATTSTDDRAGVPNDENTRSVEGTIRQINLSDGRLVIQTPQRRMLNVRTYSNTPVYYRGETFRVSNLEIGDQIRVETDPRQSASSEISARSIEVTASVQDSGSTPNGSVVTILSGRVTRIESGLDYLYVDDGRNGEIRVDMRQAYDANREVIRARDMKTGDRVEISGSYNRTGDLFLASTVRFAPGTPTRSPDRGDLGEDVRLSVVSITGTITETLEDGATLGVRDRDNNRIVRVWATESFVVRTKGGSYVRAETLRENDTVVIEAFRDAAGNLIAQSMRLRNR